MFCGSSPGARPEYAAAARRLAAVLLERGLGLVYGGGNVGLMGLMADDVIAGGGEVVGVIPRLLVDKEVAHEDLTELVVVDDMFERKGRMMELSDGFVSLPGGVGTLDELFEVLTWSQLGFLDKPCGLLDVDGFYGGLGVFLDRLVDERFLRPEHRALLLRDDDADALLDRMGAWSAPELGKRMDR